MPVICSSKRPSASLSPSLQSGRTLFEDGGKHSVFDRFGPRAGQTLATADAPLKGWRVRRGLRLGKWCVTVDGRKRIGLWEMLRLFNGKRHRLRRHANPCSDPPPSQLDEGWDPPRQVVGCACGAGPVFVLQTFKYARALSFADAYPNAMPLLKCLSRYVALP